MTKTNFQGDAIFWVEVDKISPNPYQPRKEFTEQALKDLAESIRMYGVLQPLTVTRREVQKDDGLSVEYELIAGERRLRASKLAGLINVPVIIRSGPEDDRVKLELAIIENLQREDLNPIDRALAFKQLAEQFEFTHSQIAKKVGKSREYVSNSIRLLQLPKEIQQAIMDGKISEGHARPLGMLRDKPDEQSNVFKEVVLKKLTVRETEKIARGIAKDKVRKTTNKLAPEMQRMQKQLSETLGTRVYIEPREVGGKLVIDYFSSSDVEHLLDLVNASLLNTKPGVTAAMERYEAAQANAVNSNQPASDDQAAYAPASASDESGKEEVPTNLPTSEGLNEVSVEDSVEGLGEKPKKESKIDTPATDTPADPFAYLSDQASVENTQADNASEVKQNSSDDDFGINNFSL